MVIDSSALVAILWDEPERQRFQEIIERDPVRKVSPAVIVETSMVMLARRGAPGLEELRALIGRMFLEVVPLDAAQAWHAVDAFRRFGKGRHPAGLNFGDCLSYALAQATGEALLFKGDDFPRTDIRRAT